MTARRKRGKTSGTRDFEQRNTGGGRCSCGKIRFLDKASAKLAIRRLEGRDGRLHPYKCGHFWHIGHPPSRLTAGRISRADLDEKRPT